MVHHVRVELTPVPGVYHTAQIGRRIVKEGRRADLVPVQFVIFIDDLLIVYIEGNDIHTHGKDSILPAVVVYIPQNRGGFYGVPLVGVLELPLRHSVVLGVPVITGGVIGNVGFEDVQYPFVLKIVVRDENYLHLPVLVKIGNCGSGSRHVAHR